MRAIVLAAVLSIAAFGQSTKQPIQATTIAGISSSWAGEGTGCPGTINNLSAVSRGNWYHSVVASGSGSWSVTIRYSNTSCTGPWSSYGAAATITQASNPAVAFAMDSYSAPAYYINILITGNAVATYVGENQLPLSTASGSMIFPITISQGGTGGTDVITAKGSSGLNIPFLTATDFNFTAQAPGGSLIAGGIGQSVTLAPCPPGVNGSDTEHYLYLSGGAGTAEPVLITGGTCTSGAATGTVTVTPSNGHSGAWTIGSATSGGKEAEEVAGANGGGIIQLPAGRSAIHAPLVVANSNVTIQGQGTDATVLMGDLAVSPIVQFGTLTTPVFQNRIEHLTISRAAGTIPVGSVGVLWQFWGMGSQEDIHIIRNDINEDLDYIDNSSTSCTFDSANTQIDTATTTYLKLNNVCGVHFRGAHFGGAGESVSVNPVHAIIISGRTNTVYFDQAEIIPIASPGGKTLHGVAFLNINAAGAGDVHINNSNFENFANPGGGYFYFDDSSLTNQITGLLVSATRFGDDGTQSTFAYQSTPSQLTTIIFTGNEINGILPLTNPQWATFTGNTIYGNSTFTGGTASHLILSGNIMQSTMTFTGAWLDLTICPNSWSLSTYPDISGATGNISMCGTGTAAQLIFQPIGTVLNQGQSVITSNPPVATNQYNGWKDVYYNGSGAVSAFGHAPHTSYFRETEFYGWGLANPAGDGSAGVPDSAATAYVDTYLGRFVGNSFKSTVATGTVPLVVASTTPVANLTGQLLLYKGGVQQVNAFPQWGTCAIGSTCSVTLSPAYISSSTYTCTARDTTTPANAVTVTKTSGSAVAFTGTGTDSVEFSCVGN